MFYIEYIKFKGDAEKTKQVVLLVSLTLTAAVIYFTKTTLLNFITGKNIELYEYLYIILLIYLIINVVIAVKTDGELVTEVKEKKLEETNKVNKEGKNISEVKRGKDGKMIDDFIFPTMLHYNYKNERGPIIPDIGNEGLEFPEEIGSEERENIESVEEQENHEEIKFNFEDYFKKPEDTIKQELKEDKKEDKDVSQMDVLEKKELLRSEILKGTFGKD